jgi:hypothetical protein
MICNLFLDFLEEELFKARERIIEISISKDHLFDANFDLEKHLYEWQKKFHKLKKQYQCLSKQYESLKKLHSECRNRFLYR